MGPFDNLAQIFQPAQQPDPTPVPLTPPAPVKPSVAMVRPRIAPSVKPAATSGNDNSPDSTPSSKGATSTTPPATTSGKGKFGNYLNDVAGGILTVPQNADAISAFAYGFAGAIKSGAERKLADKNAAIAAEDRQFQRDQQKFNNDIALKNLHVNDLVDDQGKVTPLGRREIDKDVTAYAKENGLTGTSADARKAAAQTAADNGYDSPQAMLDAYRQQREDELRGDFGHDTLRSNVPRGMSPSGVPTGAAVTANIRPGEEGTPKGDWWNPLDRPRTEYAGNPAGRGETTTAPSTGTPGTAYAAPGAKGAPATKSASVTGSGKATDPYSGFASEDEFNATVKPGEYFINPADGRLMQRAQ